MTDAHATPCRIIMDCDPGVDDCVALLAALASPAELDILGVCTVAGNVPVATCSTNARAIAELAGRPDLPVHAGAPRPLLVAPVFAEHIHGESGLGGARLPVPQHGVEDRHAVNFIIETLLAAPPASITLALTGPLTNLALALGMAPQIAAHIERIVLMGGAHSAGGNITASAEFNIYADPHAAQIVFGCGRPITAIGLDATLQLRCTPPRLARIRQLGSPAGAAVTAMIEHVNEVYGSVYGTEGAALHDPCVIAFLLAPQLFRARPCRIRVETESGPMRGHTAVGFDFTEGEANADWVESVQADAVFELLLERLGRL